MKWVIISIVGVVTTSRAVKLGRVSPSVISVLDSFCVVSGRGALLFITDSSDVLILSACFVSSCSFSFVNFECPLPLGYDMLDVVSDSSVFPNGFRSRFSFRVGPVVGSNLLVG